MLRRIPARLARQILAQGLLVVLLILGPLGSLGALALNGGCTPGCPCDEAESADDPCTEASTASEEAAQAVADDCADDCGDCARYACTAPALAPATITPRCTRDS